MNPLNKLIKEMLAGEKRALARVISLLEDRDSASRAIIEKIYPLTGRAFSVGITGPPGAGKSTVADKLIGEIRKQNQKAAVIAVDPSSPFSGGAILGDRIRMQGHSNDPNVYIRSLGTRGKHGGLSQASKEVVLALDAAGFDWILVETAGVGQTELDILKLAHAVCVVLVPESGDGIQVMKAGLMEIADIFVLNKSDRPEADKLVRELKTMVHMDSSLKQWEIPVIKTQALYDQGITELFSQLILFKNHAHSHGALKQKQQDFVREEITDIILDKIEQEIKIKLEENQGLDMIDSVIKKQINPYLAAEIIRSKIID